MIPESPTEDQVKALLDQMDCNVLAFAGEAVALQWADGQGRIFYQDHGHAMFGSRRGPLVIEFISGDP
jgi:hypothetical protein